MAGRMSPRSVCCGLWRAEHQAIDADLSFTIRAELADDELAIERRHERTFGPGRYAKTAYRLREGRDHSLQCSSRPA